MITIVVGAQYGGEGKGKVCAYLAHTHRYAISCRCGGPNSSHTVIHNGVEFRLRMMPAAAVVDPEISVFFGAGTLIHVATLIEEMHAIGFRGDLVIDPQAGIITDDIVAQQRADLRYREIGSTLTGTGLATALRAQRRLQLARELADLPGRVDSVAVLLQQAVSSQQSVLVEGHQGFGLSNYHGDYPYTSSRDSTAAAMLSEIGIGPRNDLEIVLVAKAFPTRNHAGKLEGEISPADAQAMGICEEGGGAWGIPNRRRRVGLPDMDLLSQAIIANSPTYLVLTGGDYLDRDLKYAARYSPSEMLDSVVRRINRMAGQQRRVKFVSTGPATEHMFAHPGFGTTGGKGSRKASTAKSLGSKADTQGELPL